MSNDFNQKKTLQRSRAQAQISACPKQCCPWCTARLSLALATSFGLMCCALPQPRSLGFVTPASVRTPRFDPGLLLVGPQSKEKLLTDLRKELAITTQEHFEVLSAVMQDKEIEALRENRAPEPPPGNAGLLDSGGQGKRKKDALGQGMGRCMGLILCASSNLFPGWSANSLGMHAPMTTLS